MQVTISCPTGPHSFSTCCKDVYKNITNIQVIINLTCMYYTWETGLIIANRVDFVITYRVRFTVQGSAADTCSVTVVKVLQ